MEGDSGRELRGLYRHVKISVNALNVIIVVLSVALVLCLGFGISRNGYQVSFDSLGGTAVESQKRMYGELLQEPEAPTREGYVFEGWYRDEGLTIPWNPAEDVVTESLTLYARWSKL